MNTADQERFIRVIGRWIRVMIEDGYHGKAIVHFDHGRPVRVEEDRFRDLADLVREYGQHS